ncbi:ribosomal biogenesis protein LAS1L isoform X2 [Neodiprion fabricii]|uniref:ribosomal biogenesis protein LAS1L isoform X2 n=1 Tax=Neodiprion fabricii TaxID=2872261 RepID=UPI001ED8E83D|nr:ribosomal biogenesis protein LAS1L isoform X2 [Neodiprion fabricii]
MPCVTTRHAKHLQMAFKRDHRKQVPWFSLTEWHDVYEQIYSNDTVEQIKGYKRLLVWKARLPKLPVGVECTLAIMQVCLRDREITPKMDKGDLPAYYENDLCLMYSTTIMRFLNHITNIGETKQSSLFQIAKQLNIPRWIVNIRHDAAHGHELPSLDVLRIATNILLEWLHEEYWATELKAMEDNITKQAEEENEPEEAQTLTDLIELWIAVGLYIHAGYTSIKDIPDAQLRETLSNLRAYALNLPNNENTEYTDIDVNTETRNDTDPCDDEKHELVAEQSNLLCQISKYLSKNKFPPDKDEIILNVLLGGEAFLPSEEFLEIFGRRKKSSSDTENCNCLPSRFINFWQEFITMLHEKEILQKLILRLLELINDETENEQKHLIASLWMKYIASSLCKIKLAHKIKHRLEHVEENKRRRTSSTILSLKVRDEVDRNFPELRDILWLNVLAGQNIEDQTELVGNENVKTINDFTALFEDHINENIRSDERLEQFNFEDNIKIADLTTRNSNWILEKEKSVDWGSCPIGILPWQLDSMDTVDTSSVVNIISLTGSKDVDIVPGIINSKSLMMRSKINWNSVLGKKKRPKWKKNLGNIDNMVDMAIQIVKKNC